jgi:hypothetical protein
MCKVIDQEKRVSRTCVTAIILQIISFGGKPFSIYHFFKLAIFCHSWSFWVTLDHFSVGRRRRSVTVFSENCGLIIQLINIFKLKKKKNWWNKDERVERGSRRGSVLFQVAHGKAYWPLGQEWGWWRKRGRGWPSGVGIEEGESSVFILCPEPAVPSSK